MEADVQVATRKASTRSPILSLVDADYLDSTANIPRNLWEPLSYLHSEMEKSVQRVTAMQVPRELEWVRQSTLKSWTQVDGWIKEVMTKSQSVDALRSWQLMGGLQAQNPTSRPMGGVVMPDFPQPQPPGPKPKRGLLRGDAKQ